MQDVVFKEMYEKKVQSHIDAIVQQVEFQARQQGWQDVLKIVFELKSENKEITIENILEKINEEFA